MPGQEPSPISAPQKPRRLRSLLCRREGICHSSRRPCRGGVRTHQMTSRGRSQDQSPRVPRFYPAPDLALQYQIRRSSKTHFLYCSLWEQSPASTCFLYTVGKRNAFSLLRVRFLFQERTIVLHRVCTCRASRFSRGGTHPIRGSSGRCSQAFPFRFAVCFHSPRYRVFLLYLQQPAGTWEVPAGCRSIL